MRTCRCWFGPSITPIVRTRVIVPTTAFPSADQNPSTPFGRTKNLMRQSPVLKSTSRFIPHGLMQSKFMRPTGPFCHQQRCGQRPHVFWKLLPFAVVIGGAPIWEEARARPRLRRISMSDQRGVVSADHYRPDPYTQSRIAERTLNAAIVHAEIARSYEEYLVIFDAFYADDVEGSSETTEEPIRGKAGVRSLVFGFLVPLHAMAEVGGVSISVRQTPIPGDVVDETHSAWTLELVGATGKVCTVSWRTFRKWSDSRVVLEHHYDHQQSGEPLSDGDLRLNVLEPPTSFHKSS